MLVNSNNMVFRLPDLFNFIYNITGLLYQEINIIKLLIGPKIDKNNIKDGGDTKLKYIHEFTFKGGHVINVYDPNTILMDSKLPYKESISYRISVSLNGIITPKLNGISVSIEEKLSAKSAQEFIHNLVFNKYIRLENIENNKYGRIFADVYMDDVHLNELLIKERYAVEKTKGPPVSWLKYKLTGEYN